MAHLVQVADDDLWMPVARYIGDLMESSGEEFVKSCRIAHDGENYADLLEQFASNLDLLYSKSTSEQDLEGSVNLICHLVPRILPPGASAAATRLAGALAATPAVRADRRLQALINLYNVVLDSQSKLAVLLQALSFSKASGLADVMLGVVRTHVDTWPTDLHLSIVEERALYVACADALRACTRKPKTAAKEAHRLLCKYLATCESAAAPAPGAEVAAVASHVVSDFLKSPDMFQFDLAANPAVAALENNPQHATLHCWMTIYLSGTVADFESFTSANASAFESLGVSREQAAGKMRLFGLMGLSHGAGEIAFKDIAKALNIPPADVEPVVVQAIGKRLMEARIDQLREVIIVGKCAPRTFGAAQWSQLQRQLKAWKGSVTKVLELGKDEKTVLPRGIAELSISA